MGNGVTRLGRCLGSCSAASSPLRLRLRRRRRHHVLPSDVLDESLGHSFCYAPFPLPLPLPLPPPPPPPLPAPCDTDTDTNNFSFRSISGAAVSANASTPLSTSLLPSSTSTSTSSSSFESSTSFASTPLFPSGPLSGPLPSDRPFMSAPIPPPQIQIQSFLSGPLNPPSTSTSTSTSTSISSLLRSLASSLSLTKHPLKLNHPPHQLPNSTNITPTPSSLQWAQGRAGEDRVHVVVSEEHGWLFVGIYDGFNGPDATDFLLTHLYPSIHLHLKGILWHDQQQQQDTKKPPGSNVKSNSTENAEKTRHVQVLKALSRALRKTEDAYLSIADNMLHENPELSLMGSCVLVMLMKGEDVYLMNVGDSRAVLASKSRSNPEGINEDLFNDFSGFLPTLSPLQLTFDHSTCTQQELIRIRNEHPDDPTAIAKDRVKGSLKVTRAFGAGFLKQPKWNNALLEMFRIDYVGTAPYITCHPSLYHYRVGPKDKFLILSSDGLYQYLTNEEAVTQVEMFLSTSPDGDPAQHLVEELLFRAAAKAGMELHELLEIPQGDRRRYYDDVSIIVISLEGQIWRSFV